MDEEAITDPFLLIDDEINEAINKLKESAEKYGYDVKITYKEKEIF